MAYRIYGNKMFTVYKTEGIKVFLQGLISMVIFFYTAVKVLEVTVNENINLAKNLQEHKDRKKM